MKHNNIVKAAHVSAEARAVSDSELALINRYTRRELCADEVYVFPVTLCDNEIDRDGERFTAEALEKLARLFEGKTGIFDHDPAAKNQTARIFSCAVEGDGDRTNSLGEPYLRLAARAYMPKTEGNRELIAAIDSGIIKEVSVGCAVEKTVCSVCGEELSDCPHQKGRSYGGRLCCGELCNPTDAYEWSFVAVPAQRGAGVTKSAGKEKSMEKLLKTLESTGGVMLSGGDCKRLLGYIDNLKQSAKDGVYYRESLTAEVLRLSAAVQPDISRDTMETVARGMTVAQLGEFKAAYEKMKNEAFAPEPQLYGGKAKQSGASNGQFTI